MPIRTEWYRTGEVRCANKDSGIELERSVVPIRTEWYRTGEVICAKRTEWYRTGEVSCANKDRLV